MSHEPPAGPGPLAHSFILADSANVLRSAGCPTQEELGWPQRGHGDMPRLPRGIIVHHTVGGPGESPSLPTVRDGRGGAQPIPGPLAQFLLGRTGIWHCVAAGLCYHAGPCSYPPWGGVHAGNAYFAGVECENSGTDEDPWPPGQLQSLHMGLAALADAWGVPPGWIIGHKEWNPIRKPFCPHLDMPALRTAVQLLRSSSAPPPRVSAEGQGS